MKVSDVKVARAIQNGDWFRASDSCAWIKQCGMVFIDEDQKTVEFPYNMIAGDEWEAKKVDLLEEEAKAAVRKMRGETLPDRVDIMKEALQKAINSKFCHTEDDMIIFKNRAKDALINNLRGPMATSGNVEVIERTLNKLVFDARRVKYVEPKITPVEEHMYSIDVACNEILEHLAKVEVEGDDYTEFAERTVHTLKKMVTAIYRHENQD